jgi:hypothetical protein
MQTRSNSAAQPSKGDTTNAKKRKNAEVASRADADGTDGTLRSKLVWQETVTLLLLPVRAGLGPRAVKKGAKELGRHDAAG